MYPSFPTDWGFILPSVTRSDVCGTSTNFSEGAGCPFRDKEITMVRIMLMYYVNLCTFLEELETDWAKLLSDADPPPEESLLF